MGHGSAGGLSSKGWWVVVPHGFCVFEPGLRWFWCVWTVGGPLGLVQRCLEGFPRGALWGYGSGGLEELLLAWWGVLGVYFRGVGLGRHEDPVCPVEDPPLGVCFEDVDGGSLGRCVEVVPRYDGYFH